MTPMEKAISEEELHGYVDGFLNADDRVRVERYLESHPEAATRIDAWQKTNELLRRGLAHKAKEPLPSSLNVQRLAETRLARTWEPRRVAAGIVLALAIGSGTGWLAHGSATPVGLTALGQQAALAQRVFVADSDKPLEFTAADLTQKVGWSNTHEARNVTAPDLSEAGYRFLGGQLVATEQGAAPMFIYQNAKGDRMCIFVRVMEAIDTNATMRPIESKDVSGFAWSHDGIGFGVLSSKPEPKLHEISDQIRDKIEIKA
jgi:anti-sigma factor RsiW